MYHGSQVGSVPRSRYWVPHIDAAMTRRAAEYGLAGYSWDQFFDDLRHPERWPRNFANEARRIAERAESGRATFQELANWIEQFRNALYGAAAGGQLPTGEARQTLFVGIAIVGGAILLLRSGKR